MGSHKLEKPGPPTTYSELCKLNDREREVGRHAYIKEDGKLPGVDLHLPGAKDDSAKVPVELVPTEAIEAIAKVMDMGRKKYTEDGWKSVPQGFRRYTAALLRHTHALLRGEVMDPESGLPHVAHMACNAAFLCWLHERGIACRVFELEEKQ